MYAISSKLNVNLTKKRELLDFELRKKNSFKIYFCLNNKKKFVKSRKQYQLQIFKRRTIQKI